MNLMNEHAGWKALAEFVKAGRRHTCGRLMLWVVFPDNRVGMVADGKAGSAFWCPKCDFWHGMGGESHVPVIVTDTHLAQMKRANWVSL